MEENTNDLPEKKYPESAMDPGPSGSGPLTHPAAAGVYAGPAQMNGPTGMVYAGPAQMNGPTGMVYAGPAQMNGPTGMVYAGPAPSAGGGGFFSNLDESMIAAQLQAQQMMVSAYAGPKPDGVNGMYLMSAGPTAAQNADQGKTRRFCVNCGALAAETDRFCTSCGSKLEEGETK